MTKKPKVALPVTKRNQSNVPPPTRHRHDQLVIALKATAHPVLPVIGPTNPRDLAGKGGDMALNPLNYPEFEGDDEVRLGIAALGGINAREGAIEVVDELRNQVDPYTTVRRLYGRTRAEDIGIPYAEPNNAEEVPEDELDF